MNDQGFDCIARLAKPEDAGRIRQFYIDHGSPANYLRSLEAFEESARRGLFCFFENPQGEIIAASGVYVQNKGDKIDSCIAKMGGFMLDASMAELGSVLRWDGGLPADKNIKGVWHTPLFGVPLMLSLQSMLMKSMPYVDHIYCDILTGSPQSTFNIQRLTTEEGGGPHRWRLFNPGRNLIDAIKRTVDATETKVDNPKQFFLATVPNLVDISREVLNICTQGLVGHDGRTLRVDMSEIVDRLTLSLDPEGRRETLMSRIVANKSTISKQPSEFGMGEFARIFFTNGLARNQGTALNGSYRATPAVRDQFVKLGNNITQVLVARGRMWGADRSSTLTVA